LSQPVWDNVFHLQFSTNENGECDCWIEVPARNVAAGEDHNHENCADGERRDNAGRAGDDSAPDGENEEEGADEFRDIFSHFSFPN